MPIKPYTSPLLIFIPKVSARIAPCIRIDTSLEAQSVNMPEDRFQTARKSCEMNEQLSIAATSSKISVINVNVIISYFFKALLRHSVSLLHYEVSAYIYAVSVPRAPAHCRFFILLR